MKTAQPLTLVFLDASSIGNTDLSALAALGNFTAYPDTSPNQVLERCREADVIITNKVKILRNEMDALPKLKLICIAATGMNNVELPAAAEKGIQVRNVPGYSTDSVAELTFTLALNLSHHLSYQDHYVKSGTYSQSGLFTNYTRTFHELRNKQWGIIGMGAIGKRVADLATCFGAQVSYHSTSGKNKVAGYPHKSLEKLLKDSDIVSIHAPLNEQTRFMIKYDQLCLMKPEAYLINVGRGKIVHETDLARALREGKLAGAGFDVFEQEPISAENPLLAEDLHEKVLLTPHIAWASIEARQRLVDATAAHIIAFSTT